MQPLQPDAPESRTATDLYEALFDQQTCLECKES